MLASKNVRVLSVRMVETELRRFKSIAASRGISLQEAAHQAIEAWASSLPGNAPEPLDTLEGSLAGVDIEGLMRGEKEAEQAKDRRWL
jgi:hypothetical protein